MTISDGLTDEQYQRLKAIMKTLGHTGGNRFRRSVASIYAVKETYRPTHLGSATLLEVDGNPILLTAAHVIDEHEQSTLYVAAGGKLLPLTGEFFISKKGRGRHRDHFDIAFTKLSKEAVDEFGDVFVPESSLCGEVTRERGRLFTAVGFPNSKNKNFDNKKLVVKAQDYSFTSVHKEEPHLSRRLTGEGEYHLQIIYDRRVRKESGEIDNAFFPRGLSGGPVIDCGRPTQVFLAREPFTPEPKIAGMTIELKHRRLIAIRLDVVLPNIRRELQKAQ